MTFMGMIEIGDLVMFLQERAREATNCANKFAADYPSKILRSRVDTRTQMPEFRERPTADPHARGRMPVPNDFTYYSNGAKTRIPETRNR